MKYRYLPHTADAKIEAFGTDINEMFKNAALATYNIMVDTEKVEPKKEIKININSENTEALLFDWIDELLLHLDASRFLLHDLNIQIDKQNDSLFLKAILKGDTISKEYELKGIVKSMTYNCMNIKKTKEGFKAIFVVDR